MSDTNEVITNQEEKHDVSITDLSAKQQRFVHLYITGQYTIPKLADLLQISHNTARYWLRDERIREIIDTYQNEEHDLVENALKNLRVSAIQKLGELVNSPIDGVALSACKDILDRSGHKAIQKVEKNVTVTTYEQQMKDLIDATIVDVTADEISET